MSVEFTVIDETEFIDRSDPAKPVDRILVTFQNSDGRVDSVSIEAKGFNKEKRNLLIKEAILKRRPSAVERVKL